VRLEYDLINELGPKNWLDCVAGEAVVLGHSLDNPELVARGTELATLIRTIPFDSDNFCMVEAKGHSLEDELARCKEGRDSSIFIDELYLSDLKEKGQFDWEFGFIYVECRYQVQMILPMYYDREKFSDPIKIEAEKRIKAKYKDPSFQSFRSESVTTACEGQTFVNTLYFDSEGKVIRRKVDFNHHGKTARGWIDYYYFYDFSKANEAWEGVREAVISGQKK
jgi:hypothetical protein